MIKIMIMNIAKILSVVMIFWKYKIKYGITWFHNLRKGKN